MKPEGMLFSRAAVAPAGVAQAVGSCAPRIQPVCPACPDGAGAGDDGAVAKQLTGNLLVNMDNVQVRGSLRTPEGRFFAVRQALAAEVTDAAAVKAALAPAGEVPGRQGAGGRLGAAGEGRHRLRAAEGPASGGGQ